jgi:G:T-mismatch repair DNA endonuclease (very short patch repair protein)
MLTKKNKKPNLTITHPELALKWHPTLNGNKKPEDYTHGCNEVIYWKCYDGKWPDGTPADDHVYEQKINHAKRHGCPCCGGKKAVPSNCLATTHPELALKWHPTLNGNKKPEDYTHGSDEVIYWKCYDGKWPDGSPADDHVYEQTINNAKRHGCPCCAGKKVVPSNCLATTHPELALKWHPTLNGDKKPEDYTYGSNEKIHWKCYDGKWPDGSPADDHVYEQTIGVAARHGCPCCAGQKVVPSNCLATTHPELALKWHPTLNGDKKPEDYTHGCNEVIHWKCYDGKWPDGSPADDHVYEQPINDATRRGCPCCSGQKVVPSNCLTTTHPELALKWHPTRNGDKKPEDYTHGCREVIWFKCGKIETHIYKQSIFSAKRQGCPICKASKGEKKIRRHLESLGYKEGIHFKSEVITKKDRPDFVLIKERLIIEFNGEQHYKPTSFGSKKENAAEKNLKRVIKNDHWKIQRSLKSENNCRLLIIGYWDLKRVPEIINDFLADKEPIFSEPPAEVKKYEKKRMEIRRRLGIEGPEILCGLIRPITKKRSRKSIPPTQPF